MTDDEREIRRNLAVLKRAEELGSAAKAYRYFGIPKLTFSDGKNLTGNLVKKVL